MDENKKKERKKVNRNRWEVGGVKIRVFSLSEIGQKKRLVTPMVSDR